MKKLLFILAFVFCFFVGKTQYNLSQNIGSSATLVQVPGNGGFRASLVNRNFTDTTAANATPIDYYAGAQIFTTSDNKFWVRDVTATYWIDITTGGDAGNLLPFNGCLKGCTVTWIENYDYAVVESVYIINGVLYESPNTTITLDPSDDTYDRIDKFVVTTSGTADAITGTPAINPEEPDIDPLTQLGISFAIVLANTTEPTIAQQWIYRENDGPPTEWTMSTPSGSINLASTNFPYAGTKDIEATDMPSTASFSGVAPATVDWSQYNALVFKIRSKGNWTANRPLSIFFQNTFTGMKTVPINLVTGQYGFTSATTGEYQNITIPLADFGQDLTGFNAIQFARTGGAGTIGWYIDDIQLMDINLDDGGNNTTTIINAPETWISDGRKQLWSLAQSLDLTYRDETKQSVTLASGQLFMHGWIYQDSKLWGLTASTPSKLFRFNDPDDLSDYDVVNLGADADATGLELVYVPYKNKIYTGSVNTDLTGVSNIYEVDPVTLNQTAIITVDENYFGPSSFAFDEEYLYVLFANGKIYKVNLTSYAYTVTTLSSGSDAHAIVRDKTYLYISTLGAQKMWKVRASDMVEITSATYGSGGMPDDMAIAGDNIWTGVENNSGLLRVISKSDLTSSTVATGVLAPCYGTFFLGKYVYATFSTSPGTIVRVDPETREIYKFQLASGEDSTNEIATDGQRMFITTFEIPSKVIRISMPTLTYVSGGPSTTITASNGLTMSTSTNVVLGGTLTGNTSITGGNFSLTLTSTASNTLVVNNTNEGNSIQASSNVSNSCTICATNTGGWTSFTGTTISSSTNTIKNVLQVTSATTGTAANGLGAAIRYAVQTAAGSVFESNTIVSKWTDATNQTSQLYITGLNSGVSSTIVYVNGNGNVGIGVDPSYRLDVFNGTTGQTAMSRVFNVSNAGATYNTTGSNLTAFLGYFSNTATESGGGNSLTNIGIYSTATGGDNNYAGYFDGTVIVNTSTTIGVSVSATSGTGVEALVSTGKAFRGVSTGANVTAEFIKNTSSTNTTVAAAYISAQSSGTAANGFGPLFDMYSEANDNSNPLAFSLRVPNIDVTAATFTTAADFYVQNSNVATRRLRLMGADGAIITGRFQTTQGVDVASAAGAIAVGTDGSVFELTGTNAVTLISNLNFQNGAKITLVFTSTATLTDGTANSGTDIGMELAGNANFVGSADDVIVLLLSEMGGVQRWREVSRSVN